MTRTWLWRKLCGESYVAKVIVKWQRGESYVAKVAVANMKRGESYSADFWYSGGFRAREIDWRKFQKNFHGLLLGYPMLKKLIFS